MENPELAMKKTIYVRLKRHKIRGVNNEVYIIEQLKNAASVSLDSTLFRVGDELNPQQADRLCEIPSYEVTINI